LFTGIATIFITTKMRVTKIGGHSVSRSVTPILVKTQFLFYFHIF